MSRHFDRAMVLVQQSNYRQAEEELRQHLVNEPGHPVGHSLLALCLAERKAFAEATDEAQRGIHFGPDIGFTHFALADVLHSRNRLNEALDVLRTAIDLDPEEVRHFALLGNIHYDARRWREALEAAEQGLAIEPENATCNNLRAMALTQLGRHSEAAETLDALLAKEPTDATAHANQGWASLDKGDHKRAMEHFREALRLEPELEWARQGILEAMKARNFIYRQLLYFFRWMGRLSRGAQWVVILGLYFGARFLGSIGRQNPEWQPLIYPLLGAYFGFVVMTWIANPLFNLLLRLDRFGRLALSPDEIRASNFVGALLLLAAAFGVAAAATGQTIFVAATVYFAILVIPVSGVFHCHKGWPRKAMTLYTLGLAALGPFTLVAGVLSPKFAPNVVLLFIIGALASSWVGNALAMNERAETLKGPDKGPTSWDAGGEALRARTPSAKRRPRSAKANEVIERHAE